METLYHGSTVTAWVSPEDGTFELPPVSVRRHVQHLEIAITINVGSFDTLAHLASIFPARKQVGISIQHYSLMTPDMRKAIREALDVAPSINFNTKTLSVNYWQYDLSGSGEFQEPLFEKLALSGKGVKEWTEPGQKLGDKVKKTWWI